MKNNILLIAHNKNKLNSIASLLSKEVKMRTLDFNKYVEYNLGRDEEFVITHLGIDYYNKKYKKAYLDLEDFEDALVISDIRICLYSDVFNKALMDLFVIVIDLPIKEQIEEISQYISNKQYLYKHKKTQLMETFRKIKSKADIVVKDKKDNEETTKAIIAKMLEGIDNE